MHTPNSTKVQSLLKPFTKKPFGYFHNYSRWGSSYHHCLSHSRSNYSLAPFPTKTYRHLCHRKDKSINQVHSTINPYYASLWKHHLNIISPYFYFRKTQDEYLILHRFNQSKEPLLQSLYLPMHYFFALNFWH